MKAIVMAAGMGTRLKEVQGPKSLVTVGQNQIYLGLQLQAMQSCGFDSIVVVGGYDFESLQSYLQTNFPQITLLRNKDYQKGNLLSLLTAEAFLKDGFFVFNADHFYSSRTYQLMNDQNQQNQLCVFFDQDRPLADDDMKIEVLRDEFSKMSKALPSHLRGYVGVTYVPENCSLEYLKTCASVLREKGDAVHVEEVVNQYAKHNVVQMIDISGSWWTEIDTDDDLAKARSIISKNIS
ncbi:MAG: NTP transferase domain-containing protein [Deltaproteobacteria bacterium]|nr:NTP transferase domain-containing protein [Deltaproteobacteria bacterium]